MKRAELAFRKAESVVFVEVPDGRLYYNEISETVILLNPTAAAVLDLCDGETDATRIAVLLQDDFQLPKPPQSDVEACLRSLVSEGLVETVSPTPAKSLIARFTKRLLHGIR